MAATSSFDLPVYWVTLSNQTTSSAASVAETSTSAAAEVEAATEYACFVSSSSTSSSATSSTWGTGWGGDTEAATGEKESGTGSFSFPYHFFFDFWNSAQECLVTVQLWKKHYSILEKLDTAIPRNLLHVLTLGSGLSAFFTEENQFPFFPIFNSFLNVPYLKDKA